MGTTRPFARAWLLVAGALASGCAATATELPSGLPVLGAIEDAPTKSQPIAPRAPPTRLDCGGLSQVSEARVDVLAGRLSAPELPSAGDLITAMSTLGPLSIGNPSEQAVVVGRAGDGYIAMVVRETFRLDPGEHRLSIARADGTRLETGPTRQAIGKLTELSYGAPDVEEIVTRDTSLRVFVARPSPRFAHRGNAFVPLVGVVVAKDGTLLVVELHVGAGLPLDRCADYGEALLAGFTAGERSITKTRGRVPIGLSDACVDAPDPIAIVDDGGIDGKRVSLNLLVPLGLGSGALRVRTVDVHEPDPEGPRALDTELFGIPTKWRGDWSEREGALKALATTAREMVSVELVAEEHAGWLTKLEKLARSMSACR